MLPKLYLTVAAYHGTVVIVHNIINYYTEYYQEYIIERGGEYPTPVYHGVVSLDSGHDLCNVIHTYHNRPRGGGF